MSISVNDSMGMAIGKLVLSPFAVIENTIQYFRLTAMNLLPAPQDQMDHGNNAGTIMLIPGFTQGSASMENIGDQLSEKYNVVYVRGLPWYTANIKTLTNHILEKYRFIEKTEKNQDISVLGHSFGGILGVVMLTDTPNIQMNRMVTIATPHDKVPLSGLIPGIPALREMEENVYRNRPKIEFKKLKSLTTVAAGKDIVVPSDSQHGHRIPISSKIPQRHETWDDFGHFSFLEPRGARKIAELLR